MKEGIGPSHGMNPAEQPRKPLFPIDAGTFQSHLGSWLESVKGDNIQPFMDGLHTFKTVNPFLYQYLDEEVYPLHIHPSDTIDRLLSPYRFAVLATHETIRRVAQSGEATMPVVSELDIQLMREFVAKYFGPNMSSDVYLHARERFFQAFTDRMPEMEWSGERIIQAIMGKLPYQEQGLRQDLRAPVMLGIAHCALPLLVSSQT